MAEGKQHALAIGLMKLPAKEMYVYYSAQLSSITYIFAHYFIVLLLFIRIEVNKGIGIDNIHYLNDGLWRMEA